MYLSIFLQSHEIHNLDIYTQYLVSVQVFNPEGLGPETTVLVMTDEGGEWNFDIINIFWIEAQELSKNGNIGAEAEAWIWY